ncbi:phenoloxidase-activating enzyme 1-like [Drosophila rhopaloa]|uniref:Inactive serine protease 45-like n=1 Tax=Drosophila rhopaloa TaxID=1041015 RepID=A0A6P4EY37_DRORH|nr:phenoloxidase-activating enzyme 1-like [Drosophila rhopaloa]
MSAVRWIILCTLLLIYKGTAQFLDSKCATVEYKGSIRTPWLAEIQTKSKLICAGSLINKRYVLTAASCIESQTQLVVRLGNFNGSLSDNSYSDNTYEEYPVSEAYVHKSYSADTHEHNIGLLKLPTAVKYKQHIKPLCITENVNNINKSLTFKILKKNAKIGFWESIKSVFGSSCADIKKQEYVSSDLIGSPFSKPIFYWGVSRNVQHGILSFSNPETYVYTNVIGYTDWIILNVLEIDIIMTNSRGVN